MTLLRIILLVVLFYYAIKILAGWIFHPGAKRVHADRHKRTRTDEERYRDLTDQRIEDAEYEDIDAEGEP